MTVTYTARVADAQCGGFYRLLMIWKGSIYKLFLKEFFVYVILYLIFSLTYRFLMSKNQRRNFERVSIYCDTYSNLIPMSFVLGFYASLILKRWWNQYQSIPIPDRLVCVISGTVEGTDERGRMYRRTLMRYCSLSALLIQRSVSTAVFKRFPTMEHVVEAGFMTPLERTKYDALPSLYHKYWIPCVWFCNLAVQAQSEGRVRDESLFKLLIQVVTIAVYSFFLASLIGRQYLDPARNITGHELDLYVPIFTLLQLFFYAGWLKVGEQLINPFGEDDDDFETNLLIDRNFQVSMLAVDGMYLDLPLMEKDRHWNDLEPRAPYTVATTSQDRSPSFHGSTVSIELNEEQMQYLPPPAIAEVSGETSSDPLPLFTRFFQGLESTGDSGSYTEETPV
ncbi:bestrophin-2a-like isoform X2 [Ascaphus truei]|uniref:bestrophin-2a-like isoform X2 n=1 Tax=Ascaphus truei TaxID=8439 RepID=UPI003F597723